MQQVTSQQGETVDLVCLRVYDRTDGVTEQVMAINSALADLPAILPSGTVIVLPDLPAQAVQTITTLWT